MAEQTRFDLSQDQMPTAWFNIMPSIVQAGMQPLPPLHPGTHEPVGPADLAPLFPESLIMQEVSDRAVDRHPRRGARHLPAVAALAAAPCDAARAGARRRRRASTSSTRGSRRRARTSRTPRSRRPTTTRRRAPKRIATETGAGQWGSALAMACAFFGIECQVFMVKASYEQKPYRRIFMETFGAEVTASPSTTTQAGKAILEGDPDSHRFARASRSARRSRSPPRTADRSSTRSARC